MTVLNRNAIRAGNGTVAKEATGEKTPSWVCDKT